MIYDLHSQSVYFAAFTISIAVSAIAFGLMLWGLASLFKRTLTDTAQSPEEEHQEGQNQRRLVWITSFLLTFGISAWVGLGVLPLAIAPPSDPNPKTEINAGTLGDQFGAANALFSGLALVRVVLAVVLQSIELRYQRSELRQSKLEAEQQTSAFQIQNHMNALTVLLNRKSQQNSRHGEDFVLERQILSLTQRFSQNADISAKEAISAALDDATCAWFDHQLSDSSKNLWFILQQEFNRLNAKEKVTELRTIWRHLDKIRRDLYGIKDYLESCERFTSFLYAINHMKLPHKEGRIPNTESGMQSAIEGFRAGYSKLQKLLIDAKLKNFEIVSVDGLEIAPQEERWDCGDDAGKS